MISPLRAHKRQRRGPEVERLKRNIFYRFQFEMAFSRSREILIYCADLSMPMAVEALLIFGASKETIEDKDVAVWPQKPFETVEPWSAWKRTRAVDRHRRIEAAFARHCQCVAQQGPYARLYSGVRGELRDEFDM